MAGLIAALFGGKARPPDPDPLPGAGGYAMPPGRTGEDGYPGSTSATRIFRGASPRAAKIRSDTDGGFEQGLSDIPQLRQQSYRGDQQDPVLAPQSPRQTPRTATPQPDLTEIMQHNAAGEFFGGPMLRTVPGLNDTAGANPLSPAELAGGHSVREGETPMTARQPQISIGVPGSENVRNQVAQRYKNPPGQLHAYRSAPRGDLPGSTPSTAAFQQVTVQNRFVFAGGGNQTWFMEREMPYGGRGDGARGAALNGQRYYATGGYDVFANGAAGQYGISRLLGPNHRPVSFTEPAPWSASYYDTTAEVGTAGQPGTPTQSPDLVYTSPQAPRAGNGTGR